METVFHSMSFDRIVKKIDLSRLGDKVGIKVHFGEEGCETYVRPELVKQVYEKISKGREARLIECGVLYRSPRARAFSHVQLARKHGFDFAPIHILDGKAGEDFVELEGCKIGAGIKDYDSLVVITHFKGHMIEGLFGGAVKNLGMGLGSREGKIDMHQSMHPVVGEECIACGKCARNCPENAISIVDGRAKIDPKKCVGCGECIEVCPKNAIKPSWKYRPAETLQERIRDYALAIINKIGPEHMVFINVLESITPRCDCSSEPQKPMMPDKGFLLGYNIDAVDLASLELTKNLGGRITDNRMNATIPYRIVKL